MLVLRRKESEGIRFILPDGIEFVIYPPAGKTMIEAPPEVRVLRSELEPREESAK